MLLYITSHLTSWAVFPFACKFQNQRLLSVTSPCNLNNVYTLFINYCHLIMEIFSVLHSLRSNCLFYQLSVKSTPTESCCASVVVWGSICWERSCIFRVLLPDVAVLPISLLFLAKQFDCQASFGFYFFLIRVFKRVTLDISPEQFSVTLTFSALWSFCAHV